MSINRTGIGGMIAPTGAIMPFAGSAVALGTSLPTGWLLCNAQTVSRTTFSTLFNTIAPLMGNPTISNASPAVVTLNGHGLIAGDTVYFTSTSSLPTGMSANTLYFVISTGLTANAFEFSASRGGSAINTSSAGSGTFSLFYCPYGLGDGSTTFTLPDLRGRFGIGSGTGTATSASSWNLGNTPTSSAGGEEKHTQTLGELVAHTHTATDTGHEHAGPNSGFVTSGVNSNAGLTLASGGQVATYTGTALTTNYMSISNAGSGTAFNIMAPLTVVNYIIKT